MSAPHQFVEDAADYSMCVCGMPALTHHIIETTADVAICDPCRDGTCDDCAGWAWCEATSFVIDCDCKDSGHQLQRDIAEDEAADRALSAHYEETA